MEPSNLDVEAVRSAVLRPVGPWASVDVLPVAASTNAELVERARAADEAGTPLDAPAALAAEHQTAGVGRAGRSWETPPHAALTVSMLLRPDVPDVALGWLPLLSGLAMVRVLRDAGVPAALKWPNDVLLPAGESLDGFGPWRKVAGILAQVVPGGGVVVGIGLNVAQATDELPVPTATSLALSGAPAPALDRTALLAALLRELAAVVERWSADDGDADVPGPGGAPSLVDEYAAVSATLGTLVRADLAGGGGTVEGTAERLSDDGALVVVRADGSVRIVAAGDVHHVREA
ncbi:biotin--[acetyl-CoA-carboxylase] ligase [Xylanimonas sp. McL0601]|uniref:biotin--[acetyl-CoA-carboxylase] ligase n=1 Tax=Xylanimonas sp. McL0601 TaxID=3414739 RepID=UPI003CEF1552